MGVTRTLLCTVYGGGDDAVAAVERMAKEWREMLEQSASEVEELREQVPQWISVDERLPAKNETLLVMCDVGVTAGSYSPAMKEWWAMSARTDGFDQNQTVTHWMPLPEPPDEA